MEVDFFELSGDAWYLQAAALKRFMPLANELTTWQNPSKSKSRKIFKVSRLTGTDWKQTIHEQN